MQVDAALETRSDVATSMSRDVPAAAMMQITAAATGFVFESGFFKYQLS
jgi:hypothetical protein